MELDKSKPFGTIHGDTSGRRFEQGGRYFGHDGKEVGGPKPVQGDKPETPKVAPKPAVSPAVNEQLAKQ